MFATSLVLAFGIAVVGDAAPAADAFVIVPLRVHIHSKPRMQFFRCQVG
jgi:hypothetical protein